MITINTVLISGSSRGIGLACATKFLKEGWKVVINGGHDKKALDEACYMLAKKYSFVMAHFADVSCYRQAEELFMAAERQFGQVDVLINNAGMSYLGLFNTMPAETWDDIVRANLNSVFNCSHLALQNMVANKKGAIVNISSVWGCRGASNEVVYSAAKGGVNSFTKALAKELAPSNIRVNAISCGVIDTVMNAGFCAEELRQSIPMGRLGTPDEVADVAFFLASERAGYITGQIIGIDGGF